jgi:putative regulator of septum formation
MTRHNSGVSQRPLLLLVSLAVVVGVSACSGSGDDVHASSTTHPSLQSTMASVAASPQVGNCYNAGKAAFHRQRDGSSPVSCRQRHTAETFAVFSTGPVPNRRTIDRIWRDCQSRFRAYVGDSTTVSTLRLTVMLPSTGQIAAGQHWVRCDAIELPGYTGHSGLPRTSSLKGALDRGVPKAFRGCARHWPRLDRSVHFTSCQRKHQTELIPESANLGGPEAAYPGRGTVKKDSKRFCLRAFQHFVPRTRHFYYYYPTRSSWRSSTHDTTCWALDPRGDGLPPV